MFRKFKKYFIVFFTVPFFHSSLLYATEEALKESNSSSSTLTITLSNRDIDETSATIGKLEIYKLKIQNKGIVNNQNNLYSDSIYYTLPHIGKREEHKIEETRNSLSMYLMYISTPTNQLKYCRNLSIIDEEKFSNIRHIYIEFFKDEKDEILAFDLNCTNNKDQKVLERLWNNKEDRHIAFAGI